jgi:hypothetical protein
MRSSEACAGREAPLVPAASFVTEAGDLCRQCFAGYQNGVHMRAGDGGVQQRAINGKQSRSVVTMMLTRRYVAEHRAVPRLIWVRIPTAKR